MYKSKRRGKINELTVGESLSVTMVRKRLVATCLHFGFV